MIAEIKQYLRDKYTDFQIMHFHDLINRYGPEHAIKLMGGGEDWELRAIIHTSRSMAGAASACADAFRQLAAEINALSISVLQMLEEETA